MSANLDLSCVVVYVVYVVSSGCIAKEDTH
jgi:hypothetical protein